MSFDEGFSSDDDDLLLELKSKPPRATQIAANTQPTQIPIVNTNDPVGTELTNLQMQLTAAQGEASMLRDKIKLLNQEKDEDNKLRNITKQNLAEHHIGELRKLQSEIQSLQDENKFLLIESKRLSSKNSHHTKNTERRQESSSSTASFNVHSNNVTAVNDSAGNTTVSSNSPILKKRKIEESLLLSPNDDVLKVNSTIVLPDEIGLYVDSLLAFKITGIDLTVIEILNKIKLDYIDDYQFETFHKSRDESIGKSLVQLLLASKITMSLDIMIDNLLENLAILIKEITLNKRESKLAVPFLVALMYKAVSFRPSAVHNLALKDLFFFLCDLVKKYQHVLKCSLHESPLDLNVQPAIFQYELIDSLVVLYSFDLLEMTFRILQLQSDEVLQDFFDKDIIKNIELIYKLALPISFLPISNIVINAVEIINLLSTMCLTIKLNSKIELISSKWWRDCTTRLYDILNKNVSNQNDNSLDNKSLYLSKYFNCFGLIRNIGDNSIARFISDLIDVDSLRSVPRVISKDDILEISTDFTLNSELEKLFLQLKDEILSTIDDLMKVYDTSTDIINTELLIQLTKMMSEEQNLMISKYIVQISMNLDVRCNLIEHYLTLIYKLWACHEDKLNSMQIKDKIQSELVTSLWRVVVSHVEKKRWGYELDSPEQLNSSKELEVYNQGDLVEQFAELELEDDILLYQDVFEDMPNYVREEIMKDAAEHYPRIIQIKYGEIYQEMAKNILETKLEISTSMEDIDSIYLTMGN
ncbi:hypothetical protein TPHA_0B04650 [Tetrapisispora phaffii CBS 4417]|uniref:DNA damage checkpoint protein LCD1 n=1 Tax=Tetrapisispora phaffii (strain ATCC 24235 / CBS 4417 / NBRC 1672 / NRRL Y-8282 / UCD 70-5) TaxID=1071381 RepID=G8BQ53_TETPH|nr:hypothetical protein TPHA_0B04650 [Tetrapisispora phaffii CBS 4417]CCE62134.1 hypothetical protein TPHA_0B04650 [Tetrapisispora phaffii CBS 4417]